MAKYLVPKADVTFKKGLGEHKNLAEKKMQSLWLRFLTEVEIITVPSSAKEMKPLSMSLSRFGMSGRPLSPSSRSAFDAISHGFA